MTTTDRINTLARESVETAFETTATVQRQNTEFFQTWLNTVETNQQQLRDLSLRALEQAQEAQRLWVELSRELVRTSVENVTNLTQTQLKEATEGLDKVSRQARANGTRETASK